MHARKAIIRKIRQSCAAEYARYCLKRGSQLDLPSVSLSLTIKQGDVLIDCGANVGDITSKFARTPATVYAFEPNPVCFSILKRRFVALPHVHCINAGVMDRDCRLTLQTPEAHEQWDAIDATVAASFTEGAMQSQRYRVRAVEVACIDLNAFIRSLNTRVRLLKLDIEGSEIAVLNRLIDTSAIDLVDRVVVETHERQIPKLQNATDILRDRIKSRGLGAKICLDWH